MSRLHDERASAASRRGGWATMLASLSLACAALAACAPGPDPTADVKLACTIAPLPPHVGTATVDVTLAENGRPLTGAKLRVRGEASRGTTSSATSVLESGGGRYRAQLELTVRGDWVIAIDAELPDGRSLARTFDVHDVLPR